MIHFAELPDSIKACIQRLEHCTAAVAALEIKLEHATAEAANARRELAAAIDEHAHAAAVAGADQALHVARAVKS